MTGLRLIVPEAVGIAPVNPFHVPVNTQVADAEQAGALQFAGKAQDILDHEAAIKRTTDLANSTVDFQNALDAKRVELDADPDHGGREKKFQDFANAQMAQRTAGMDDETKALFVRGAQPVAGGMAMSVRHQARKDAVDEAVVSLKASNDDLTNKAADARNPLERDGYLAQIQTNNDTAFKANMLTPAQYQAFQKSSLTAVDTATALKAIRENPGAAASTLSSGHAFPNLDVVAREKLIDAANSESRARLGQALAIEARNDRIETKAAAVRSEAYAKTIDAAAADNVLTRDMLEKARPYLTKQDYNVGLTRLAGAGVQDSRDVLADVVPKLASQDLSGQLTKAFLNRDLSDPTYRALMDQNRTLLEKDQPAGPYKQGYEFVNGALNPGQLLSGPAADLARQGHTNAVLEYNTWATANRDAIKKDPGLAVQAAQDIVQRYRIINFDKIGAAIGLPQGFTGTRETITPGDIDAAGKRVLQQFDLKQISEPEKNLELRKLQQWDEILKQKNATDATALQPPKAKP